jgi:hypothetical protein
MEVEEAKLPVLRVDEYACVKRDRSPGHNRPDGYVSITKIAGFGGASIASVQMDKLQGDGCLQHNIALAFLTRARFI